MSRIISWLLFITIACTACQNEKTPSDPDKKLVVAVAANAQFAMESIKKAFERTSDANVELIIGSSGKLATQIIQGAPYDVFLSADMAYPDSIFRADSTLEAPVPYAYGTIVMWTCKNADLTSGIRILSDPSIKKIAIANPKTAPYGEQTLRMLTNLRMYNSDLDDKLVYGESIAQVNQYITSGNCEVGFTAKAVVLAPEMAGKGTWIAMNPISYQPIAQGMIVTKHGKENHPNSSQAFFDFLLSDKAQAILVEYGYLLPAKKRHISE